MSDSNEPFQGIQKSEVGPKRKSLESAGLSSNGRDMAISANKKLVADGG